MGDQAVKEERKVRSPYSLLNRGQGISSAEDLTEGLTGGRQTQEPIQLPRPQAGIDQDRAKTDSRTSRADRSETPVPIIPEVALPEVTRPELALPEVDQAKDRADSRQILSMPSLSSGFSLDREILNPLQNIVNDLETELSFEQAKLKGAMSNRDTAIKEGEKGSFTYLNAVTWTLNRPYWLMHSTTNLFKWGICEEPPTSLGAQNKAIIAECEAQIKFQGSVVKGIEAKISEITEHMGALKGLNDTLMSNRDPRQFLSIRREIQERQSAILSLVDEARKIDDPSKKEEWNKKRAELGNGFQAIENQLQFTETGLRVMQKVCVISGAMTTRAIFAKSGTQVSIGAATAAGGGISLLQIGAENLSRYFHGMEQLSNDEMVSKLGSDTKDALLYSSGGRLSEAVTGGVKAYGGKVVMGKAAQTAINSGLAKSTIDIVKSHSALRSMFHYGRVLAGSLSSGGAQAAITESVPAMVDTIHGCLTERIAEKHFWWEFLHRIQSAGTGGAIGRGFSSGRASINSLALSAMNSPNGGIKTKAITGLLTGTAHVGSAVAEVVVDTRATIWMEPGMAGWLYGKNGELSPSEREQIIISTIIGNVSGWHSEYTNRTTNIDHNQTLRDAVEKVHTQANRAASRVGLDSDQSVYVGRGETKDIRVKAQTRGEHSLAIHLGRDPRVGGRTNLHRVTNEISARIDQRLGGRVKSEVEIVMNQVERIVPEVEGSPTHNKDRQKFVASLRRELELRASGISSTGSNTGDLLRRANEYNDSRHLRNKSEFRLSERIGLAFGKFVNPFGFDQVLKVEPPDSNLILNNVSNFKAGLSSTVGTMFRVVLGNPFVNKVNELKSKADKAYGRIVSDRVELLKDYASDTLAKTKPKNAFISGIFDKIGASSRNTAAFTGGYIPVAKDVSNIFFAPAYGVLKSTLFIPPPSVFPGVGLILAGGSVIYNIGVNAQSLGFGVLQRTPLNRFTPSTPREAAKMLAHIEEGEFYRRRIEKALDDPLVANRDKARLSKELESINKELRECRPLLEKAMQNYVRFLSRSENRIIPESTEGSIRNLVRAGYENASRVDLNRVIDNASEQFKKSGLNERTNVEEFSSKFLPHVVKDTSKIAETARDRVLDESIITLTQGIEKIDARINRLEGEISTLEANKPEAQARKIRKKKDQLEALRETRVTQSTKKEMVEAAKAGKKWAEIREGHPDTLPEKPKSNLSGLARQYELSVVKSEMSQSMRRLARKDGAESDAELTERYQEAFDKLVSQQKPEKLEAFIKAQQSLLSRSRIVREIVDEASNSENILAAIRLHDVDANAPYAGVKKINEITGFIQVNNSKGWIDGLAPSRFTEIDRMYKDWRTSSDPRRTTLEEQIEEAIRIERESGAHAADRSALSELARFELGITARAEFDAALRNILNAPPRDMPDGAQLGRREAQLRNDIFKSLDAFAKEITENPISQRITGQEDGTPFARIEKGLQAWENVSKMISEIDSNADVRSLYQAMKDSGMKPRAIRELLIQRIEKLDTLRHELDNLTLNHITRSSFLLDGIAELQSKVRGQSQKEIKKFVREFVDVFNPRPDGLSRRKQAEFDSLRIDRIDQRVERLIKSGGQEFLEMQKMLDLYQRLKDAETQAGKALSPAESGQLDQALRIFERLISPQREGDPDIRVDQPLHPDTIRTMDTLLARRNPDFQELMPFALSIKRWNEFNAEAAKIGIEPKDVQQLQKILETPSSIQALSKDPRITLVEQLASKYDNIPEAKNYFASIVNNWETVNSNCQSYLVSKALLLKLEKSVPVKAKEGQLSRDLVQFISDKSPPSPLVAEFISKIRTLQDLAYKDVFLSADHKKYLSRVSSSLNDGAESILKDIALFIRQSRSVVNGEPTIEKQIEMLGDMLTIVSSDPDISM